MVFRRLFAVVVLLGIWPLALSAAESDITRDLVAEALRKAVDFYRTQVGVQGGYLWQYSADLKWRAGEEEASATTAWIQPPGTPAVGLAFLRAFELTGDRYYLEAARETAMALVKGQLQSGGWDNRIEFAPEDRRRYAYRVDAERNEEGRKLFNVTTLDDNKTQSAALCLLRIDQALKFDDKTIHEAARFALDSLVKAQYPNGAWPQRYSEFPNPKDYPVKRASYPDDWPREFPKTNYGSHYTFNDNLMPDMVDLMLAAADVYGDERYRVAAEKGGDFIILSQMPEPQSAWAQQYDVNMHPVWARRFEPPSITGGESQGLIRTLMVLYRATGQRKYLEPIGPALAYLKRSELPNGRLARFYELKTNRPLYFTRQYELTYEPNDLPTHYAFIIDSRVDRLEDEYRKLLESGPPRQTAQKPRTYRMSEALADRAKQIIEQMDQRGAWVEKGRPRRQETGTAADGVINMRTFLRNVETLSEFLAASAAN